MQKTYSKKQLDFCREQNHCPDNEKLCREAVWLYQTALLGTKDDMNDIADATEKIYENRDKLAKELRSRGLHPLPSQANFLLVPVEPAGAVEVNRALRERGVAGRPFPALPEVGEALRITVGPWDMMQRFLDALDQLFQPPPSGVDSR